MTTPLHKVLALEVHPGRHCLQGIRQPKVRILAQGYNGPAIHQITVLPVSHNNDALERLAEIPDLAWVPAREGRGKVLFDASQEGWPHSPDRTRIFHDVLNRTGVPLSQAVYVTQHRGYEADYREHCQELGLGETMQVVVFDYWLRALARQNETTAEEEFEVRLAAYRARPRRRPWRFLSLNRILRPTKALFLLRLLDEGLWDRGAISLGGVHRLAEKLKGGLKVESKLFDVPEFDDLNQRLRPVLPRLVALDQIEFKTGNAQPKFWPVLDEPLAEYGQTWCSVVTETEMKNRLSRITEKSIKPLRNFHPLIVLGNPGSLKLLKSFGFETYEGLFDETYDQELDPRRRFEMVFDEVRRVCGMDETELDRLERDFDEVLIFNARHALTVLPQVYRWQVDPALIAAILGETSAADAGLRQFN